MASKSFRQDMPPEGGYAAIKYAKVPHKKIFTSWMLFGAFIGISYWSASRWCKWKAYINKLDVEKYDSLIALQPFLGAERDREYLKTLRALRNEERDLMKNHYGWEVGTLYGEPLYKTVPAGEMVAIPGMEYYGHRTYPDSWQYTWPDMWL